MSQLRKSSSAASQPIAAYVEHYHRERNHQGLGNALGH